MCPPHGGQRHLETERAAAAAGPKPLGRLQFGRGSNSFLAPEDGSIFVTELGPAASERELAQVGIFGARQQFAIQFSEEDAFAAGYRVVGADIERSIYTIPGGAEFAPGIVTRRY